MPSRRCSLSAIAAIAAFGVSAPAAAQDARPLHWSAEIVADAGLAEAEAELSARADAPEDAFALAGVRFLRGVERAVQARYRVAAAEVGYAPVLRLPIPRNPDPAPYADDFLEGVLRDLLVDMAAVRDALKTDPQVSVAPDSRAENWGATFDLAALWIDVDGDGSHTPDGRESERLFGMAAAAGLGRPVDSGSVVVRFDAADAAWLEAYSHLISAFAEFALAFDPTAATAAARPGWDAAARFDGRALELGEFGAWADQAAVPLTMLRTDPDPERIQAAHGHLRAMIAANRRFWALVEAETDDAAEWIPNATQSSAWGGARVTAETAAAWRAVLDDFDAVLTGRLLMPHWRYATREGWSVGIDVSAYVADPVPLDPTLWLQGAAAAPYLREGPTIDGASLRAFERLAGRNALGLAAWLN